MLTELISDKVFRDGSGRRNRVRVKDLRWLRDNWLRMTESDLYSETGKRICELHANDLDFLIRGGRIDVSREEKR